MVANGLGEYEIGTPDPNDPRTQEMVKDAKDLQDNDVIRVGKDRAAKKVAEASGLAGEEMPIDLVKEAGVGVALSRVRGLIRRAFGKKP